MTQREVITSANGESEVEAFQFAAHEGIPNHPWYPLLVYRQPLGAGGHGAEDWERCFSAQGWAGLWRNGVFSFHHYHAEAHEVLGVASGCATVLFGGPDGVRVELVAGDAVAIPAGVGHKAEEASEDFQVVGAYPVGQEPDLKRLTDYLSDAERKKICAVPVPNLDPVFSKLGPVQERWVAPANSEEKG